MVVKRRPLGHTGMLVSEIALGTAELGMDYGFRGTGAYRRPARESAVALVRAAMEMGINLIDTAGAYGESEAIVGEALRGRAERPYIATKVTIPGAEENVPAAMRRSIENSLRALRVESLDLLQLHNATPETLGSEEVVRTLEDAVRSGSVRCAGASVYDVQSALLVLENPLFRLLQVPFNVLDQKMSDEVFPRAAAAGVAVLARSAFLRGILTDPDAAAPAELARLQRAAQAAWERAQGAAASLAELALRFCLSVPGISSVLVGVRSQRELAGNVAAAARGPLPPGLLQALYTFSLGDDPLLNPTNWKGLI